MRVFKKSKHEHVIKEIADHMREIDVFEMHAIGVTDVEDGIRRSIEESDVVLFLADGRQRPLCIFGVSRESYEHGHVIWCLGTDDIDKHKKDFVLFSRYVLTWWTNQYGRLFNYVSAKNDKSIRWLKSMGATVDIPKPINDDGDLFRLFTLDRRE